MLKINKPWNDMRNLNGYYKVKEDNLEWLHTIGFWLLWYYGKGETVGTVKTSIKISVQYYNGEHMPFYTCLNSQNVQYKDEP